MTNDDASIMYEDPEEGRNDALNRRTINIVTGLMLALMLASGCLRYLFVFEPVFKTAITKEELNQSGKQYILCEWTNNGGWVIVQDGSGEASGEACRIAGESPLQAGFWDEHILTDNVFVMYWKSLKTDYSEELGKEIPAYEVADWTVLAPVKRDFPFNLYKPEKYMVNSDINAKAQASQ